MKKISKLLPLLVLAVVLTGCGAKKEVCKVKKGSMARNIVVEMKTSFDGNPSELDIDFDQRISDLYGVKDSEFKASDITKNMQKEDAKMFKDELNSMISKYFSIKGVKKEDVKKQTKITVKFDKKDKKYVININVDLKELYKDIDYTASYKELKKDMKKLFKNTANAKVKCEEQLLL